jgi:hypothetical protein
VQHQLIRHLQHVGSATQHAERKMSKHDPVGWMPACMYI